MRNDPTPDSIEDLMARGLSRSEAEAMTGAYRQELDRRIMDEHGNERTLGPGRPITEEPDQSGDVNARNQRR